MALFDRPPLPGLARWAPLLPPLADGLSMGEGGTPLVAATPRLRDWAGLANLHIKDESRNPTWSHKDRLNLLNLCAVSAAVAVGAPGGGVVIGQPWRGRGRLRGASRAALHCADLQHHPAGGLGRLPALVCVPTGYAELLYGIYKGFQELRNLGVADQIPRLIACEPAIRAPLAQALACDLPAITVEPTATAAYSIAVTVSSYRGVLAVRGSGGQAVTISEVELAEAQAELARAGLWQERSGAAGLAAARQLAQRGLQPDGPVVCIAISSGFKDLGLGADPVPHSAPDWDALRATLLEWYGVRT